jgi:hypothetical protein
MPQDKTPFISQPCGDPVGGLVAGGPYGIFRIMSVDSSGNVNVNVVSGGGGGGGGNVNLTQVNGSTISLGQTTMANSLPVVISSNQSAIPVTGTVAVTQTTSPWVVSLASTTITGSVAVTGTFFQATQPVSGTVTALQGTSPWVVSLASTTITGSVSVTQGTSPWVISGTVAVSNFPASQVVTLASTTITGTVAVTQSTSPWVVSLASTTITGTPSFNLAQLNAVALGSPSNYGTSPGAVSVQGVNAFITNTPAVTLASTTITGTVSVTQGTSPWVVSLTSTTITGTVSVTQGTSPWVVSLASTTITGTVAVDGALTNNNAAPTATLLGVLGAIAETAYATVTYTTGDMVLPVTDLHGAFNVDLQALAGTALGAPTIWGTAPTGLEVQGVNADCFQSTSPWVVSLASTTITGTVSVTQGTSPWVVSLTSTTVTNTVAVTGALTNNNAAPTATLLGVLGAIAETAYTTVTYTTGDMVLPVTDLHGAFNTDLQAVGGVAVVSASAGVQKVGISGAAGATLDAVITAATAPTDGLATLVEYASTAPALTTGQSVMVQANSAGDTFVKPFRRSETVSKPTTISLTATATAVVAAPATGFFADISSLFISATPAASTALVFTATLSDGTSSYIFDLDTGTVASAVGAPLNLHFNPPLKATTAATGWTIALSVATVVVHITTIATLNTAS